MKLSPVTSYNVEENVDGNIFELFHSRDDTQNETHEHSNKPKTQHIITGPSHCIIVIFI